MKKCLTALFLIGCGSLFAGTVWQETFSGGSTMQSNGYKPDGENPTDKIIWENNELVYHCTKGAPARFRKPVPFLRKGTFSFEIKINEKNAKGYNHLSPMIGYCGMLVYGNGGMKSIVRYDAVKKDDVVLFPSENNVWTKIMIRFDADKKTAKYYVNDMYHPAYVDENFSFAPGVENKPYILLGNYAMARETIVNRFRNIQLTDDSEPDLSKQYLVWEEKFSGATMEANGYRKITNNTKDRFEITNGELRIHCYNAPYKGLQYQKRIPFLRRGELSFELNVNAEQGTGYNHLSLMMELYRSLLICPNGGNRYFQVYNPAKGNNHNIAPLKNGQWYRVAIRFDLEKKINEYYINDMNNPVFVDDHAPYDLKRSAVPMLMLGNYGLAAGKIVNAVRNIQLKTLKVESNELGKAERLSGTVILNGHSSPGYHLSAFGNKAEGEDEKVFFQISMNHNEKPINRLNFEQLPGFDLARPPRLLILCDISSKDAIPNFVERQIEAVVKRGTTLLYLGGLFNLNKGNLQGTIMEKMLPVICGKPFDMKFFDPAVPLDGFPDAKVSAMHLVKAKPDAEIKSSLHGNPFVVVGKYGHGKVIAVTGFSNVERGNFGNSAQWIESIRTIINQ